MVQRAESMYGELPCVPTHFPAKGRARHAFNCFLQTRAATASPRAGTNTHVPPCRHPPGHVPRDVCSMHTLQLTALQAGPQKTPFCRQKPPNLAQRCVLIALSGTAGTSPGERSHPQRRRLQNALEALHFHIHPRRIVTRCNNTPRSQGPRLRDFIGLLTWTTKFFREDISRDRQFRQAFFSI